MRNALFRAGGAFGTALALLLAKSNSLFRVFGQYEPAEICTADLSTPQGAAKAGVDTLFNLVGVPYPQLALHAKVIGIALEAAASAGVRRFVHVSTVYPHG
jgi:hypothetical protein